jgi:4-hydroxybenzoate polyprenyltransferase
VRYGERTAAIAAAVFYLSSVLLSPTPLFLNIGIVSFRFIPLVTITDVGLVASSIMLVRDYSAGSAKKVKNIVLLWFIIDLLAFFVGALR